MTCFLYGGYTISRYPRDPKTEEPEHIKIQERMPLSRLLEHGLDSSSIQEIQKFQQGLTSRDSSKVYLLEPNEQDVKWALNHIRQDAWAMRAMLRREAKAVLQRGGRDELRSMSREELFSSFRQLITRVPVEMGEAHVRWHHLLTEREGLPYEDRSRVLQRIENLQNNNSIELVADGCFNIYMPRGGDEQWHLLQGERRLVLDRSNCSVLDIYNFQSENHCFETHNKWAEWLIGTLSTDHRIDIASPGGHIPLPELGGLGDLHQWEALIGKGKTPEILPSVEDISEQQPPDAWMPGMSGVFVDAAGQGIVVDSPPELALGVQLYNIGNLVHTGYPAQASRLNKQPDAVRLFQPVNPFRAAPLPMSNQSCSG